MGSSLKEDHRQEAGRDALENLNIRHLVRVLAHEVRKRRGFAYTEDLLR